MQYIVIETLNISSEWKTTMDSQPVNSAIGTKNTNIQPARKLTNRYVLNEIDSIDIFSIQYDLKDYLRQNDSCWVVPRLHAAVCKTGGDLGERARGSAKLEFNDSGEGKT